MTGEQGLLLVTCALSLYGVGQVWLVQLEEEIMKFGTLTFLTVISFGVVATPVRLAAQNLSSDIITFDAPDASPVADSFDGTFPKSINNAGVITGHYIDASTFYHGFLRSPGGEFTTFEAPGAGTSVGFRFGTFPNSINVPSSININDRGAVTGNYVDANNVSHGFLRSARGEFMTLDAPGASSAAGSFDGIFPSSINSGGANTGNYIDSKDLNHGFLRTPAGEFTAFDAPGASSMAAFGYGTFPMSINDAEAITGHFADGNGLYHGFLRSPGGEFSTFDAPSVSSATGPGNGTLPTCINAGGVVTGHYADGRNVNHGFVRSPGGKFTTFDVPGAGTDEGSGFGTIPASINDAGAITGHYADGRNVNHGFVRSPGGKFTTFDVPGAGTDEGSGFGTFPASINDAGAGTGHYTDARGLNHGFLRSP